MFINEIYGYICYHMYIHIYIYNIHVCVCVCVMQEPPRKRKILRGAVCWHCLMHVGSCRIWMRCGDLQESAVLGRAIRVLLS